ncbi:MAG: VWA domain-containing protein [Planctomycetaceae bacterium]
MTPLDNRWESELDNLDLTGSLGELNQGSNGDGSGTGGIFTADLTGKDIVYVVDASASMNSPYPGREKSRFGRVKIELIRAIRSMSPDRKFFIIFFNTEAMPMPGRKMQLAGEQNADEALIWMSKHRAEGETDPSNAIQLALSMRPDVIHFLTDGEINPLLIETVRKINQGRVSINTYCISNRDGENTVLKIAEQNRGTYKFVP